MEEIVGLFEHLKAGKDKGQGGLREIADKFHQAESKIKHLTALLQERELEITDLTERNREFKMQKENVEHHLEEVTMQFNEQRDEIEQSFKLREAELTSDKKRLQEDFDAKKTQFDMKIVEFKEKEKSLTDDISLIRQQNKSLIQELETIKKGKLIRADWKK